MNSNQVPIITLFLAAMIGALVATIGYWLVGLSFGALLNGWSYSKSQSHFQEYSRMKRASIGAIFGILVSGLVWITISNILNGEVSVLVF